MSSCYSKLWKLQPSITSLWHKCKISPRENNVYSTYCKTLIIRVTLFSRGHYQWFIQNTLFAQCPTCSSIILPLKRYWQGLNFHVSMLSTLRENKVLADKKCFTVLMPGFEYIMLSWCWFWTNSVWATVKALTFFYVYNITFSRFCDITITVSLPCQVTSSCDITITLPFPCRWWGYVQVLSFSQSLSWADRIPPPDCRVTSSCDITITLPFPYRWWGCEPVSSSSRNPSWADRIPPPDCRACYSGLRPSYQAMSGWSCWNYLTLTPSPWHWNRQGQQLSSFTYNNS